MKRDFWDIQMQMCWCTPLWMLCLERRPLGISASIFRIRTTPIRGRTASVGGLLDEKQYVISNIDATVIAQRPKLAAFIPDMVTTIAEALGLSENQVNIKATTEEGLGFTGSGEGISAQAVCLLETVANYRYEDVLEKPDCAGCKGCPKAED